MRSPSTRTTPAPGQSRRAPPTRRSAGSQPSPTLLLELEGPRPHAGRARRARPRSASSRSTARARARGAVRAIGETRRPRRPSRWLAAPRIPRRRSASARAASGATRGRDRVLVRDATARRGRARSAGGVRCPRTAGAAWRARERHAARRDAAGVGAGRGWGAAKGSKPSLGPDRRLRAATARGLRRACAACAARPGDAPFNGIAKTTRRRAHLERSCTRRPTGRPPNLDRLVDRGARARGRPLRLVRRALRPRGRRPAIPTSATRPTSSAPTARRDGGAHLGPGQLRAPRRRPLGEPRPRRHHRPTASTWTRSTRSASSSPTPTSASSAARTAGASWIGSTRGRARALAQHDLLGRLRPRGEGPRVGRLQRDARPAAAEDVAAHRPRALPGRRRRLRRTADGTGRRRTRACRRARSPTCSSTPRARRAGAPSTRRPSGAASTSPPTTARTWTLEERRARRTRQPFAWRITRVGGRHALPGGRAAQRARPHRRRGRRRALPLDGRRRALDAHDAARRHERPERPHRRPRRTRGGSTWRPGAWPRPAATPAAASS